MELDERQQYTTATPWRVGFWALWVVSAVWLAATVYFSASAMYMLTTTSVDWREQFPPTAALFLAMLLPLPLAWLLLRALRHRKRKARWPLILSAAWPLMPLLIFLLIAAGVMYGKSLLREEARRRMTTGHIDYRCAADDAGDHNRGAIPASFILAEHRKPKGRIWTFRREHGHVVAMVPFSANTGSIGGSVGMQWRERADMPKVTAILSFSDIYRAYGTTEVWGQLKATEDRSLPDPEDRTYVGFRCEPDPASYRTDD